MYCPQCGTQNDGTVRYCKGCGCDLSTTSLYTASRRNAPTSNNRMDLCEALYHAIDAHGVSILNDQRLLLSLVSDYCDQGTSVYRMFEYNCDYEFLSLFAGLAPNATDEAALDEAANRAYLLLCARSAEPAVAEETCRCIRNALARHLGLQEVAARQPNTWYGVDDRRMDDEAGSYTTRLTPDETTQLPRPRGTVRVDRGGQSMDGQGMDGMSGADASGMDRMPEDYYVDNPDTYTPGPSSTTNTIYVAPPTNPQQPSAGSPNNGVSRGLVALLAVLILAIGGVSYALLSGSLQTGDEQSAPSADSSSDETVDEGTVKAETCTVKFIKGGSDVTGTMTKSKMEVTKGEKVKLPECTYKREGYTFDCWLGDDDKTYDVGERVQINEDMSFTPTWKQTQTTKKDDNQSTSSSNNKPRTTDTNTTPSMPSDSVAANSFPLKWQGTYTGFYDATGTIQRQLLFEFNRPSDTGNLSGICYVGVYETGPHALYGKYYIEGTVNWRTGNIHLRGTSWIEQGGLGDLREYEGTVNFSTYTMSGSCYDVGTGAYESNWSASSTSTLYWNTDTGYEEEKKDPEPSSDSSSESETDFSSAWTGTYEGWTSHGETGDDSISRSVSFFFESVGEDGSLSGYCYVGVDEGGDGATQASYTIEGHVDWDTGAIHVEGTSWIVQGGLDDLRQYDGTVDFDSNTMSGTASDVGTGAYAGPFSMSAIL